MNNFSAKDSFFIFEEKNISERQNSVAATVSTFVVSLLLHECCRSLGITCLVFSFLNLDSFLTFSLMFQLAVPSGNESSNENRVIQYLKPTTN